MVTKEKAPKLPKPVFANDAIYSLIQKLTSYEPDGRPKISDVVAELEKEEEKSNAEKISGSGDHYMASPVLHKKEGQEKEQGDYTISPPGANSNSISDKS